MPRQEEGGGPPTGGRTEREGTGLLDLKQELLDWKQFDGGNEGLVAATEPARVPMALNSSSRSNAAGQWAQSSVAKDPNFPSGSSNAEGYRPPMEPYYGEVQSLGEPWMESGNWSQHRFGTAAPSAPSLDEGDYTLADESVEFPPLLDTPLGSLIVEPSAPPAELLDIQDQPLGRIVLPPESDGRASDLPTAPAGYQDTFARMSLASKSKRGWMLWGAGVRRMRRFIVLEGHHLSNYSGEDTMKDDPMWKIDLRNNPVTRGREPFELIVHLDQRTISLFCSSEEERDSWLTAVQDSASKVITNYYEIVRHLGSGSFAQVYLAVDKRTNEKVALKKITKSNCGKRELEFLRNEISIMQNIKHPNIISTRDVFDSKSNLYIVLEFMPGGEFFDVISSSGFFTEKNAVAVMRNIVEGVSYLHMHGIIHRDLKPENLLCTSKSWPLTVKVADFGLAGYTGDKHDTTPVGTLSYMAPEMLKHEEYGTEVDMWSIGVILYVILSGRMPFFGRNDDECIERITRGRVFFPDQYWSHISEQAIGLIRSLLQVDPKKRLTAKATLNHRWMTGTNPTDTNIGNDRSDLHSRRRFRRAAFAALSLEKMSKLIGEEHKHGLDHNAPH